MSLALHHEDKYVGEKKNQLRHGYGTYSYRNKFFRYEGQWENGLKHGHGKLFLGKNGYYEGSFNHGEIEGHGYKVFGISGASYTGQLHHGELHGQGLLKKPNGEQYEGSWFDGQKEGNGILTGSDGSIYEGGFHRDLRHGEGLQIYKNGDQYEGDWIIGMRHGHGMLNGADGTIYDGQWRGDMYHGEGNIVHASGVTYNGMWINGNPQNPAVSLRVIESDIVIEQGKTFNISFECIDEDGNVTSFAESGRSFSVTASIQKPTPSVSRSRSRLSVLRKVKMEELTSTPFGYSTYAYELLQVPQTHSSLPSTPLPSSPMHSLMCTLPGSISNRTVTFDSENQSESTNSDEVVIKSEDIDKKIISKEAKEADILYKTSSSNVMLHSSSFVSPKVRKQSESMAVQGSRHTLLSQSVLLSNKEDSKLFGSKEEEFIASLLEPEIITTEDGKGMIRDLFLPPPPPPDISASTTSKSLDTTSSKLSLKSSISQSTKSPSPSKKKIDSQFSLRSKEKLCQPRREKYCSPGLYVLVIKEVTTPPFIGSHLEDLYVEVIVVSHKTASKDVSVESLLRNKIGTTS